MVGRADDDRVNVFIFKHFAVIFVQLRALALGFFDVGGALIQYTLVNVAEGNAFYIAELKVRS